MKGPRQPREIEVDWPALERAFALFDPTFEGEPLPYLSLRSGRIAYFGAEEGVDLADTLDFERHAALTLPLQAALERRARMRAFAATVAPELAERLRQALLQERGVARFYEVLEAHPAALARWQRAELPRVRDLMDEWLRAEALLPRTPRP